MEYDFSGWATRNNIKCTDGRTIRQDAFQHNDGKVVPLIWNHQHNTPENTLGKVLLENRETGVYAYGQFNDTESGQTAKQLVKHGDVSALSIYANRLRQNGGDVLHGEIQEVSLVLAGANPGAYIDDIIAHGDNSDFEAIIYSGEPLELFHGEKPSLKPEMVKEEKKEETLAHKDRTVADVFNTLTDKQKDAVYILIGSYLSDENDDDDDDDEMKQCDFNEDVLAHEDEGGETVGDILSTLNEEQKIVVMAMLDEVIKQQKAKEGESDMKHNVFENDLDKRDVLMHMQQQMEDVLTDAKRYGSLRESYLAHAQEYGFDEPELLFPEDHNLTSTPVLIYNHEEWVNEVMSGVHHVPFARVKSMFADISENDARAKGYIKATQKTEDVFSLLKRSTAPTTIYKKQKMDRDDIIDITNWDVVGFIKNEMKLLLNEEIARAILIGDGRSNASNDKINETCVRNIWKEEDLFTIKKDVIYPANATDDQKGKSIIRAAIKARKDYRGSGKPVLFTTEDQLTNMLLIEDNNGRVIYDSVDKLATAMRVSKIVTVPVMENQVRTDTDSHKHKLIGIIVNLADYTVGADKGGNVTMFEDFDIDYNQEKYLIETRISGAMTKPYSAIVLEEPVTA